VSPPYKNAGYAPAWLHHPHYHYRYHSINLLITETVCATVRFHAQQRYGSWLVNYSTSQ